MLLPESLVHGHLQSLTSTARILWSTTSLEVSGEESKAYRKRRATPALFLAYYSSPPRCQAFHLYFQRTKRAFPTPRNAALLARGCGGDVRRQTPFPPNGPSRLPLQIPTAAAPRPIGGAGLGAPPPRRRRSTLARGEAAARPLASLVPAVGSRSRAPGHRAGRCRKADGTPETTGGRKGRLRGHGARRSGGSDAPLSGGGGSPPARWVSVNHLRVGLEGCHPPRLCLLLVS